MQPQPTTNHLLDKLESAASDKLVNLSTLEELKTAAELSEAIANSRKTDSEARHYQRYLRLEGIKSASSLFVPLVSLLTLFGTILIQSYQLSETRQENEDKDWRELLASVKVSVKENVPDVTIAPRIKSFFGSSRYQVQAKEISKRILGQLTFEPGFRDLFETIFGSPTLKEISDTVDIGRTLRITKGAIEARCLNASSEFLSRDDIPTVRFFGLCARQLSDATFSKLVVSQKNADQLLQARQSYFEVLKEQDFIRERIIQVVRNNYTKGKASDTKVDLSRIELAGGDLSGVDFSNFDMSGVVLDYVDLNGAILTPYKGADTLQVWGAAWWKAEKIDPALLKYSVTTGFPYYDQDVRYPPADEPEKTYYYSRVKAFCSPPQDFCDEKNLKYGNKRPERSAPSSTAP
jgi:hypothetical protein